MENLLKIYSNTEFMVKGADDALVYFTANTAVNFEILKQKQFAIITAWNPQNKALSVEENILLNKRLEDKLSKSDWVYYPSVGRLGDHSEESFTVEDISKEDATQLGLDFDQNAILFNDKEDVKFIFME